MTYEPRAGEDISQCIQAMIALAAELHLEVRAKFNDMTLCVGPESVVDEVFAAYQAEVDRKSEEWRNSAAGKRQEAESCAFRKQADWARRQGFPPFTFREPEGEMNWQAFLANNQDAYGQGTLRYAARWAHGMERAMRDGAALKDIADRESHEADLEGVTGFMYSCAVGVLGHCWAHGDELKEVLGR